jgi:hypothetical protein
VTIGGVINYHPKTIGLGDIFFWVIVGWVMSEKQFWVIMGGMVESQFFHPINGSGEPWVGLFCIPDLKNLFHNYDIFFAAQNEEDHHCEHRRQSRRPF